MLSESTPELNVLTGEIRKLREQLATNQQPPVIKKTEKSSESEGESKNMKIFQKLRNEIKSLRGEIMKATTPKNRLEIYYLFIYFALKLII